MWEDGARGWAAKRIRNGYGWGGGIRRRDCVAAKGLVDGRKGTLCCVASLLLIFQKYAFRFVCLQSTVNTISFPCLRGTRTSIPLP